MAQSEADRSLHFLVVDDDAESRAQVVEYLRHVGFNRVTLAHDGADALRFLDRDPSINFIISDWEMPLINGLTLLQKVKSNPRRAHIPFLLITSPITEEAQKVVSAAENMVDGYLIKPFRSALLHDKIQKILTVSAMGFGKQLLVVDDNEEAREMVIEFVKNIGFRDVRGFVDGAAALAYISENPNKVGLIISDWEMPQMSGIELLRACKGDRSAAVIPFLMMTSQTSIERMKVMQAARANVDQYLLKPFSAGDLRKRIEDVLEKSKTHSEVKRLVDAGLEQIETGRYQKAATKFEQALKIDPENETALRGMADSIAKIKGLQAALPYFKKAIEASPAQPRNYLRLAQVYDQLGWIDRAIALLQTANSLVSFNAELHCALGKLYSKKNRVDEARAEFEKTLEIQLDHQEARLMLEMLNNQRKGST